ncbi:hypothetical protein R3W88_014925 [Solanum pinnatisectum]|uniref:Uncharacterized protein n=1 Tax=Solanum pinnatisectum TaxID=50273 RepID=A0AAV9KT22_9SOLN|nr:hypothetical protein R3W88_014925 [Solanum pinnatisectum]
MARIYFEHGEDSTLKQAFVSSLPKMLVGHAMKIIEDRFKSITIPHIGYIRKAMFQALDRIYMKKYACSQTDLIIKSDCSGSCYRARQKSVKQYRRFKLPRPPDNQSR